MFGCLRHILPAAAGFFSVAAVWAGAGYLPQAGPIPLRFRALPPPVTNAPVASTSTAPSFLEFAQDFVGWRGDENESSSAPLPVAAANPPAIEYRAKDPVAAPDPAFAPDPVISPQMLVKYFMAPAIAPTNSPGMGTVAPLGFMPPTVAAPPAKAANSASP